MCKVQAKWRSIKQRRWYLQTLAATRIQKHARRLKWVKRHNAWRNGDRKKVLWVQRTVKARWKRLARERYLASLEYNVRDSSVDVSEDDLKRSESVRSSLGFGKKNNTQQDDLKALIDVRCYTKSQRTNKQNQPP